MKITDVSAFVLRLPHVTDACDGSQDTCLIRITTESGLVGWGEVDSCPTVVKAVIDAPLSHQICNGLGNILKGRDAGDIEGCMRAMYDGANYYGASASAPTPWRESTSRSGTLPARPRANRSARF